MLLDRYTLLARQRPALLMLFPVLVAAVILFPALQSWWATLLAVTGTCGVAVALAEFAQFRGKAKEPELINQWGGLPSVAMLRHRDDRLDPTTKARYKAFCMSRITDLRFPDAASEQKDPAAADLAYHSATRWLLAHTRDKKLFALLFQHNISYGFRRNLYGLRRYGIAATVSALLGLFVAVAISVASHTEVRAEIVVGFFVCAAPLWFWIIIVRPAWIETAADAYAYELLAACDRLASAPAGHQ